ncbi:MAG: HlyD family secretion protein [Bacteroidia bacterium]|nr:HlyD family secretion protein [Bacteroidia bacterium]
MLNISQNSIQGKIDQTDYSAFGLTLRPNLAFLFRSWIVGLFMIALILLFLPWTQNINARGYITTLRPNQRPQEIQSTIAGRIEEWYVNEGDTVMAGDTIVRLSEIKVDYFDPELVARTGQQINFKEMSVVAYDDKVRALENQMAALRAAREIKIGEGTNKVEQATFKVRADSIDLRAAFVSDSIAQVQLRRARQLFEQDIKSRADLEKQNKARQDAQAKLISQRNKLAQSRVALSTAKLSLANVRNEYAEKLAKSESDKQSVLSSKFDTQTSIRKMENQLSNYEKRRDFLYILAPQEGLINKAIKPGIGETVKEGEAVVAIAPVNPLLAVEVYIRPVDIPLIHKGAPVRLEFDGWPAVTFGGGWSELGGRFGTFGGKIYAVQNEISSNGLYRVLIEEDGSDREWPKQIRIGSGVNSFALLNQRPVWYELWRQLNGFPPDFYSGPVEGVSNTLKGKTKDTGIKTK